MTQLEQLKVQPYAYEKRDLQMPLLFIQLQSKFHQTAGCQR